MTPERISELRARLEGVTPGPWEAIPEAGVANFRTSLYSEGYKGLLIACGDQNGTHTADIEFCATFDPPTVTELLDEIERLQAALKKERTRACDAEYMANAYRNMLGEKGTAVAKMWDAKGVTRLHIDWGPDAWKITGEERAQHLLDFEDMVAVEVTDDD